MNMHEYRIIKYIYEKVIQIKMKLVRGECAVRRRWKGGFVAN